MKLFCATEKHTDFQNHIKDFLKAVKTDMLTTV